MNYNISFKGNLIALFWAEGLQWEIEKALLDLHVGPVLMIKILVVKNSQYPRILVQISSIVGNERYVNQQKMSKNACTDVTKYCRKGYNS